MCFLVWITTACSLLPVFNYLYPIFTFVLVSCKFIGNVKSLSTHWACLHSHLALARECASEITSLFMLSVSWVVSPHRAAVLCTWDLLCETELNDALQFTPALVIASPASTASPYTPTLVGLHFLLTPAVACNQQQVNFISCLPQ